jgi:hypothetical protein
VVKKQLNIIILVGIVIIITATSGCIDTAIDFMDGSLYEYDGPDKLNTSDTYPESGNDESRVEENEPYVERNEPYVEENSSNSEYIGEGAYHPGSPFNSAPED